MTIKILIAAHKKYHMPNDFIYLPMAGGAKDIEGFQKDNEGENISDKNPYFCELTSLYWGWKNLDSDFVGLAHYRRHFAGGKKSNWKFARVLTKEEAEILCTKYDIILPKKRAYYIETLSSHYKHTHDIEHLELTREIIRRICPEYLSDFDKIMKRRSGHMFNMMIMKKNKLDEYCSWLFPILFELEKEVDVSQMSVFDKRLFGRVSELLLDVWLCHTKYKYHEISYVQIGETNWVSKAKGFLMAKFGKKKYDQSK